MRLISLRLKGATFMKVKFKKQAYLVNAVEAIVACYAGQPKADGVNFVLILVELKKVFRKACLLMQGSSMANKA